MSTIHPIQLNTGTTGSADTVLDLERSTGSGDLLIQANGTYGGPGYDNDVIALQSPTISGPWTTLPTPIATTFQTPEPGGQPPGAAALIPFTWSARFIQITLTPATGSAISAAVIIPGHNQLK
jgi:hypothetical protein